MIMGYCTNFQGDDQSYVSEATMRISKSMLGKPTDFICSQFCYIVKG